MSKLNSLKDLFIDEIKDLYSAEKQLVAALPKMADAANDPELKQGVEDHLQQTRGHVQRLEQVFQIVGEKPQPKTCKAMQGLIDEGKETLDMKGENSVLDAALISMAQRIEHYEIAAYGCVRTYARLLGYQDAEHLLNETLQEEAQTDQKLTTLAETKVNPKARQAVGASR